MTFKFDMHIHSRHSVDGLMSVKKIFEIAREKGLGGIAIADHNSFDGALEALESAPDDLIIIPAAELSTDCGHMLCYFMTELPDTAGITRINGKYPFDEVQKFVHDSNGLIFAAHPYREDFFQERALPYIDGVEAFNARNTSRRGNANQLAAKLSRENRLAFSAGSDAHTPMEIAYGLRCFDLPEHPSEEALRSAVLSKCGAYYGRYSALYKEAAGGIVSAVKHKHFKRLAKNTCKLVISAGLDTTRFIRPYTRDIMGGQYFVIGGSKNVSV